MIDANFILSKLPAYTATKKTLVANQSISDIKKAILKAHELDKKQYSIIAPYFIGNTVEKTCENIFDFLRKNVNNVVENIDNQSIKTPSAIVATGYTSGSDCKNYSLFTGGILDAINRSGLQKIPLAYRFAKYQQSDGSYLNHVFIVVYPNTKKEIWVDCISDVPYFNHKKTPNFFKDYKINSMALNRISGINTSIHNVIYGLETERKKRLKNGSIKINSMADLKYLKAIENTKKMGNIYDVKNPTNSITEQPYYLINQFRPQNLNGINFNDVSSLINSVSNLDLKSGVSLAVEAIIPGAGIIVTPLLNLFKNIFGNNPNPNDWQGWDAQTQPKGQPNGTSAAWWTITDGDSPKNEMVNVLSYMKNSPNGLQNVFLAANQVYNLKPQQFAEKLIEKLQRVGFSNEAQMFAQQMQQAQTGKNKPNLTANNGSDNVPNSITKINPLLLIGGAFLVAKITKII